MRRYLFDANAISLLILGTPPEKWFRRWKEIKERRRVLLLFEPLISEVFYKNTSKHGRKSCMDKILWLKSLPNVEIHRMNDNDAFNAGKIKVDFARYGLSLVDCFLLSIGKYQGSTIFTTDHEVRDVARKMRVNVDFLPFQSPVSDGKT